MQHTGTPQTFKGSSASENGRDAPIEDGASARSRMRLLKWRPLVRNLLRGLVDVELPNGLRIRDAPVLVSNGRARATLPAKALIVDGQQRLDGAGEQLFLPVIEWRDKALRGRFSASVTELLLEQHPDVLGQ